MNKLVMLLMSLNVLVCTLVTPALKHMEHKGFVKGCESTMTDLYNDAGIKKIDIESLHKF